MKKAMLVALLVLVTAGLAPAATLTGTVRRLSVTNDFTAVHLTTQPQGVCIWGIFADEGDTAYDRWLSMLISAYTSATAITLSYDATTCDILSMYLGT